MSPLRIPKRSPLSKALGLDVKAGQKFNAKRTELHGITFDSQKEANYYAELLIRVRRGEVEDVQVQPKFPLYVHALATGSPAAQIGVYRGDFRYRVVATREHVVIDCKGMRTPLYRWKKKHVEAQYGIQIQEV